MRVTEISSPEQLQKKKTPQVGSNETLQNPAPDWNISIKHQTYTSIKPCPNGKCLAIIHEQTLFGDEHFPVWTPCLIVTCLIKFKGRQTFDQTKQWGSLDFSTRTNFQFQFSGFTLSQHTPISSHCLFSNREGQGTCYEKLLRDWEHSRVC